MRASAQIKVRAALWGLGVSLLVVGCKTRNGESGLADVGAVPTPFAGQAACDAVAGSCQPNDKACGVNLEGFLMREGRGPNGATALAVAEAFYKSLDTSVAARGLGEGYVAEQGLVANQPIDKLVQKVQTSALSVAERFAGPETLTAVQEYAINARADALQNADPARAMQELSGLINAMEIRAQSAAVVARQGGQPDEVTRSFQYTAIARQAAGDMLLVDAKNTNSAVTEINTLHDDISRQLGQDSAEVALGNAEYLIAEATAIVRKAAMDPGQAQADLASFEQKLGGQEGASTFLAEAVLTEGAAAAYAQQTNPTSPLAKLQLNAPDFFSGSGKLAGLGLGSLNINPADVKMATDAARSMVINTNEAGATMVQGDVIARLGAIYTRSIATRAPQAFSGALTGEKFQERASRRLRIEAKIRPAA